MTTTTKTISIIPIENPLNPDNVGWWFHDQLVVPDNQWQLFHRYKTEQLLFQYGSDGIGKPPRVTKMLSAIEGRYEFFLDTDRSTIDEIHAVEPDWIPWTDLVWGRSVAVSSEHPPPSFRPSRIPEKYWEVLMGRFNNSGMGHWTTSGLDKDSWRRYHIRAARPLAGLNITDPYARKEPGLRAWRKAVIARDGHRCTACGATELLEAHHISSYGEDEARRVDISNGRTLCHTCHRNLHGLKS